MTFRFLRVNNLFEDVYSGDVLANPHITSVVRVKSGFVESFVGSV